VRVDDVFETPEFIYIIMEYARGGELFEYIVANRRVKEKEARRFFRMILSAVDYCHRVIHFPSFLNPLLESYFCSHHNDYLFPLQEKVNASLFVECSYTPRSKTRKSSLGREQGNKDNRLWFREYLPEQPVAGYVLWVTVLCRSGNDTWEEVPWTGCGYVEFGGDFICLAVRATSF
jgi:hypothetical protein